jgi:hypothetical protein
MLIDVQSGGLYYNGLISVSVSNNIYQATLNSRVGTITFSNIMYNLGNGNVLGFTINNNKSTSNSLCIISIIEYLAIPGSSLLISRIDTSTAGQIIIYLYNPNSVGSGTNWQFTFIFQLLN